MICRNCKKRETEQSYKQCAECINNKHQWAIKRKELGICANCESGRLPNSKLCEYHNIKHLAKLRLHNTGATEFLINLLEKQKRKCVYCRIDIIISVNAQLDHIKSIKRFIKLEYELSNLQWLCQYCNRAKSDMSETEFRIWLKRISNNWTLS